jgi:hypothetical protein
MEFSKRKNILIKDNIFENINPTSRNIEALKAFMHITIAKKNTFFESEFKLSLVVGVKHTQKSEEGNSLTEFGRVFPEEFGVG